MLAVLAALVVAAELLVLTLQRPAAGTRQAFPLLKEIMGEREITEVLHLEGAAAEVRQQVAQPEEITAPERAEMAPHRLSLAAASLTLAAVAAEIPGQLRRRAALVAVATDNARVQQRLPEPAIPAEVEADAAPLEVQF